MIRSSQRAAAAVAVLGLMLGACGGSSHGASQTSTSTTQPPPPVTHANPVALLPTIPQVSSLIKPSVAPSRYDETVSPSTLSSAFALRVPRAMSMTSGTAELEVIGRSGAFLDVHVFVFKSSAGAESLTPTFLSSTRLSSRSGQPSGAPGQQGQASSQRYGNGQVSYRYAFRQDNVLSYVELDGRQSRYSLAQAIHVAALEAQRIQAAA